jgi:hypothetical protein
MTRHGSVTPMTLGNMRENGVWNGAITFSDLIGKLDVLVVECEKCGRRGRYAVRRLIETQGHDGKVIDWKDGITGDCPRKVSGNYSDQCAARCPDLAKVLYSRWQRPSRLGGLSSSAASGPSISGSSLRPTPKLRSARPPICSASRANVASGWLRSRSLRLAERRRHAERRSRRLLLPADLESTARDRSHRHVLAASENPLPNPARPRSAGGNLNGRGRPAG